MKKLRKRRTPENEAAKDCVADLFLFVSVSSHRFQNSMLAGSLHTMLIDDVTTSLLAMQNSVCFLEIDIQSSQAQALATYPLLHIRRKNAIQLSARHTAPTPRTIGARVTGLTKFGTTPGGGAWAGISARERLDIFGEARGAAREIRADKRGKFPQR